MEQNTEEVVSTQKTLSSTHDPGWNDPPSWALAAAAQKATTGGMPTKRLLNKRVAFPLNSTQSPSSSPSSLNLPPPVGIPPPVSIGIGLTTAPHKPIVTPTGLKIKITNDNLEISKVEALKETLDNLKSLLEKVDTVNGEEIKKRLEKMESMWNEDKLNNTVYKQVLEISRALKENDADKADQLHIQLMMNNAFVCSLWIPGIRQLITELRQGKDVI